MKNELNQTCRVLVKNANRKGVFLRKEPYQLQQLALIVGRLYDEEIDMMHSMMMGGVSLGSWRYWNFKLCLALEQLELLFYGAVVAGGYYANANGRRKGTIMVNLEKHERSRIEEFFKSGIGKYGHC